MIFFMRLLRFAFKNPPGPFKVTLLLVSLLTYGSTGFLYFELPHNPQLSWLDGVWYAIVTVTTVGYGDLSPVSVGGRYLIAVPLMLLGIGLFGYVLGLAASALVEAKGKELRGMSQLKVSDHLIIINYPGPDKVLRVLAELAADPSFSKKEPVVLIDDDLTELPPELRKMHVHFVHGEPTREDTLQRACLETAKSALILSKKSGASDSDHQCVAVCLTVEAMRPEIRTIVECVDTNTQALLKSTGCDSIVCTSRFDAHFLAHELLNPGVQEVVDQLTSNLHGQQIYLTPLGDEGAGSFAKLIERCKSEGHLALGIRREEHSHLNLDPSFKVEKDDVLITIGQHRLSL